MSVDPDKLNRHREDRQWCNEFQDLLKSRGIPVAREGWVPKEDFEIEKDDLRLLIREIATSIKDDKHRQQFLENIARWDMTNWQV